MNNQITKAKKIFNKNHGILRTCRAIELGIHPRTLYSMEKKNIIEKMSRGVWRLIDHIPENLDLVTVALAIPKGVICLISALSYYDLTTQIPRKIDIALLRNSKKPTLNYPPIRILYFSKKMFEIGIKKYKIDNVEIKIFSREKTIVDCFRLRNKIGLDVAIEALKFYLRDDKSNIKHLLHLAKHCRIFNIIKPYIEGIVHE